MQKYISSKLLIVFGLFIFPLVMLAQVNTVTFGKNRLQHKKFKWKFYQSKNFNTYVAQGGTELGKFVASVAEEELPSIETFVEYSLGKKTDVVVYNSYEDYKQSNIGLGQDWQSGGGLTNLVNNKIVVYFDGNHNNLKLQIRQGLAKVLTANILFGENIGEFASNQALLDLPVWLTDGYIAYAAEPWNATLDNELKEVINSEKYTKFYRFADKKPLLAGHAFWYFIAEKYKPENVTYFLYLARIYKTLNGASLKICKKKFKDLLKEFMEYEAEKYEKDDAKRKDIPKGSISASEDVSKNDYYRFQVNPNKRNNSYAEVEFKKGIYKVKYIDDYGDATTLLESGVLTRQGDISPNYPIITWDVKGRNLLVIYTERGQTKMFVYDLVAGYIKDRQPIDYFDQILDASYMLDDNTVILSAVKNGHSDIYTYKIEEREIKQITNDIYDDLNPTFVSFPNKTGIIFSSNRPGNNAPNSDTVLPSRNRFNIFMVDLLNTGATKQVTQLTNLKYGNAKSPMQYNTNHFTFVCDANGIANRYAGFFSTQRTGLDTVYKIGDGILTNPTAKELDSTLAAWQKQEPDSIGYYQVYKDSSYSFPLTNYSSSILESRIAGNNGQISEVKLDGEYKNLYKVTVNEGALHNRNVDARPTTYMKNIIQADKDATGKATIYKKGDENKTTNQFQNDFADEKPDSAVLQLIEKSKEINRNNITKSNAKLFNYSYHFNTDYVEAGVTSSVLINRYQQYMGGQSPIVLNNGAPLNLTLGLGTSDLLEDIKFYGGIGLDVNNLGQKNVFFSFVNNRRMIDWGLTYYRSNSLFGFSDSLHTFSQYTNLYQVNATLPLNVVKSFRGSFAFRTDRNVVKTIDQASIGIPDYVSKFLLAHIEYVHDNTLNPMQNIWNGMRYKVYFDINTPYLDVGKVSKIFNSVDLSKSTYNLGFDFRYYKPIYRNFIWAGRAAGDFSWGKQKIVYFLGGVDGWLNPQINRNPPAQDQTYAYQSLTVNMRGYNQNIANGNNAVVINSEFRLPVFSTFIESPINNAFIRNFQLIQFVDLGTAWNGKYNGIHRPYQDYTLDNNPITVRIDAGGLGPFAGGYGFGARSNLLGYFAKLDCGWPMKGVVKGAPIWYFALGFDF